MSEIWLDTANLSEIKKWSWLITGTTTNPSLISKENMNFRDLVSEITKIVKGPVSVEATSEDSEGMVKEAEEFSKWADNVIVKIPMTVEGLKAVKILSNKGFIKTNVTLVFSPNQALLAARCGATYVSPFVGRLDDFIRDDFHIPFEKHDYFYGIPENKIGIHELLSEYGSVSGADLVWKIVKIYKNYDISTKIIAASIRNVRQAEELLEAGTDILTIPPEILEKMFRHQKTDEGLELFKKDWEKVKK